MKECIPYWSTSLYASSIGSIRTKFLLIIITSPSFKAEDEIWDRLEANGKIKRNCKQKIFFFFSPSPDFYLDLNYKDDLEKDLEGARPVLFKWELEGDFSHMNYKDEFVVFT